MGARFRLALGALTAGALVGAAGLTMAGPASAGEVYDCQTLCNQLHTWSNNTSVSDLWYRLDSGYLQALANMQAGPGGVQARALCERGNGGKQWYESTIKVYNGQSSSHYDCGNNGTYNFTIVGNGADMS